MRLTSTTSIVTGGASGLGAATVEALSKAGSQVYVLDLEAAVTAADPVRSAHYLAVDVRDAEQVHAAVSTAAAYARHHEAPLRVAVNCAGIAPSMRVVGRKGAHDPELFANTVAVNLVGTFNVLVEAAAAMKENEPTAEGSTGVIVNTASIAAFDGQVGQVAYAASKGGIVGMTLPAARDLASYGIRVCTIAPGLMETPMFAAFSADQQVELAKSVPFPPRLGQPREFARLVELIVEHEYLNGETIRMDGAIRLPPR